MYPIIRTSLEVYRAGKSPKIKITDGYSCDMHIWPWDLDVFMELNNGRALTLYDIPRLAWGRASGFNDLSSKLGYKIGVAGSSVIYRRRVTLGQKITITAKLAGIDDRFFYVLQNMKRGDEFVGQVLVRKFAAKNGIENPYELLQHLGMKREEIPELPEWVQLWIKAESTRPWPPEE